MMATFDVNDLGMTVQLHLQRVIPEFPIGHLSGSSRHLRCDGQRNRCHVTVGDSVCMYVQLMCLRRACHWTCCHRVYSRDPTSTEALSSEQGTVSMPVVVT